ncbi:Metalloproteinase inhibitor 2 [Desmophyllum pertusum]|uniref:Metalloproteinase inhibitor 2 n=1 Tax=Desmophyllum pertusum TaxID=174260 RepID=A0A9X0CNH4_9CNID|nr:Metalloproteinase inhibitor 2 [Desmophyllum pertusum]
MAARLYFVVLCVLLSCYATVYAGLMQLEHPQQAFCEADFVIRAVVVAGPKTEGQHDVFTITIKEVFKGLSHGQQERAFGVFDTELTTKLHTPYSYMSDKVSGPFGIKMGTEYFLYGDIIEGGKLFTKFSDLREPWARVSSRQKANLRGYFEAGCRQCQFKPHACAGSDPECRQRLPGCEQKARELSFSWKSICWRRFEHCEVDETGQRCHWKETSESQECKNSNSPSKWFIWKKK